MGLAEAKKYIKALHRRQEDPYLWPDYLTGLPDKAAIIKKLGEVFPKLGRYSVACVRIANIQPYLLKYGPDRHAEIIQWAAGILKTTCGKCPDSFVGTLATHDFIVICATDELSRLMNEAVKLFRKIAGTYYSEEDLLSGTTLSYTRDGKRVSVGLMRLVYSIAAKGLHADKNRLIKEMVKVCGKLEAAGEESAFISGDAGCR